MQILAFLLQKLDEPNLPSFFPYYDIIAAPHFVTVLKLIFSCGYCSLFCFVQVRLQPLLTSGVLLSQLNQAVFHNLVVLLLPIRKNSQKGGKNQLAENFQEQNKINQRTQIFLYSAHYMRSKE